MISITFLLSTLIVNLSGGARLIIEDTAAFTAVDIDSGSLSPNKANDTAVLVLADEMRRRALGGAIIVDLIPCKGRGSYIKRLRELVARDPVPTRVIGLTPEGRIEINRRRIRLSLEDELLDRNAKTSLSPITIGLEALRRCVRLALADGSTNVTVIAHPIVINLLKTTLKTAFLEAVYTLKVSIRLEESENLKVAFYDILVK
jgi:ribonuclease G